MMVHVYCPSCLKEHKVPVPDVFITRGYGSYICPETGTEVRIEFTVKATLPPSFTTFEVEEAERLAKQAEEEWRMQEDGRTAHETRDY
jgi:hypothetical protein